MCLSPHFPDNVVSDSPDTVLCLQGTEVWQREKALLETSWIDRKESQARLHRIVSATGTIKRLWYELLWYELLLVQENRSWRSSELRWKLTRKSWPTKAALLWL